MAARQYAWVLLFVLALDGAVPLAALRIKSSHRSCCDSACCCDSGHCNMNGMRGPDSCSMAANKHSQGCAVDCRCSISSAPVAVLVNHFPLYFEIPALKPSCRLPIRSRRALLSRAGLREGYGPPAFHPPKQLG
ncbi:MAG: hypothetical protein ACRD1O_06190 [Terriglobia bacterium]